MKIILLTALFFTMLCAAGTDTNASAHKRLVLGGVEVLPGSNVTIAIELPKLYNMPVELPVQVIRGKEDGPTVFVSAAIHGDELNGIEIIRRFRNQKILEELKGTVILVPIVNVYGVINRTRYLPDRRDLNRHFPGSVKGSLASRIAKIFTDEIVSKCDLGIDLHTAAMHRSNLPQIRTDIDNPETLRLAKAFEAPVVLHSRLRDRSLRASGLESGVPILLYEAGEALRFDETSIRIGVKGILNVLYAKGMLPNKIGEHTTKSPIVVRSTHWLRASQSGMIQMVKGLGDTVKEHEIIAYISAPLEEKTYEIRALYDGIIIGKLEIPLIQEGDAVFNIANFGNLEAANRKIEFFSEDIIQENSLCGFSDEEVIE